MKVVRDDDRDCAFSNFGVIFAGDVAMGVKEMARVVKGNGGCEGKVRFWFDVGFPCLSHSLCFSSFAAVVGATAWAEKVRSRTRSRTGKS